MDEVILTQRCVPLNFLLQGIEQGLEQHAVSLENVCICAFHPKGNISTANGTKNLSRSIGSVT